MAYFLRQVALQNNEAPLIINIIGSEFRIGREAVAELRNLMKISRRHAVFHRTRKGLLSIKDLGSTYGLYINSVKVEANLSHDLIPGDLIGLGVADESSVEHGFLGILCARSVPDDSVITIADDDVIPTSNADTKFSDKGLADLKDAEVDVICDDCIAISNVTTQLNTIQLIDLEEGPEFIRVTGDIPTTSKTPKLNIEQFDLEKDLKTIRVIDDITTRSDTPKLNIIKKVHLEKYPTFGTVTDDIPTASKTSKLNIEKFDLAKDLKFITVTDTTTRVETPELNTIKKVDLEKDPKVITVTDDIPTTSKTPKLNIEKFDLAKDLKFITVTDTTTRSETPKLNIIEKVDLEIDPKFITVTDAITTRRETPKLNIIEIVDLTAVEEESESALNEVETEERIDESEANFQEIVEIDEQSDDTSTNSQENVAVPDESFPIVASHIPQKTLENKKSILPFEDGKSDSASHKKDDDFICFAKEKPLSHKYVDNDKARALYSQDSLPLAANDKTVTSLPSNSEEDSRYLLCNKSKILPNDGNSSEKLPITSTPSHSGGLFRNFTTDNEHEVDDSIFSKTESNLTPHIYNISSGLEESSNNHNVQNSSLPTAPIEVTNTVFVNVYLPERRESSVTVNLVSTSAEIPNRISDQLENQALPKAKVQKPRIRNIAPTKSPKNTNVNESIKFKQHWSKIKSNQTLSTRSQTDVLEIQQNANCPDVSVSSKEVQTDFAELQKDITLPEATKPRKRGRPRKVLTDPKPKPAQRRKLCEKGKTVVQKRKKTRENAALSKSYVHMNEDSYLQDEDAVTVSNHETNYDISLSHSFKEKPRYKDLSKSNDNLDTPNQDVSRGVTKPSFSSNHLDSSNSMKNIIFLVKYGENRSEVLNSQLSDRESAEEDNASVLNNIVNPIERAACTPKKPAKRKRSPERNGVHEANKSEQHRSKVKIDQKAPTQSQTDVLETQQNVIFASGSGRVCSKEVPTDFAELQNDIALPEATKPKKRGRPRKVQMQNDITLPEATKPRKPGRPRKVLTDPKFKPDQRRKLCEKEETAVEKRKKARELIAFADIKKKAPKNEDNSKSMSKAKEKLPKLLPDLSTSCKSDVINFKDSNTFLSNYRIPKKKNIDFQEEKKSETKDNDLNNDVIKVTQRDGKTCFITFGSSYIHSTAKKLNSNISATTSTTQVVPQNEDFNIYKIKVTERNSKITSPRVIPKQLQKNAALPKITTTFTQAIPKHVTEKSNYNKSNTSYIRNRQFETLKTAYEKNLSH